MAILQERQAAVQDMAWRQGMEVNRARDEAEEVTEQYWQLHDALLEKQQEMDEMEAQLESARSQAVGLQVGPPPPPPPPPPPLLPCS